MTQWPPPPNWYKLLVSIKEIPEPYTPKCFPQPEQRSTTQHAHNHSFKPGRMTKTLTRFKPRLTDCPNQNEKITQPQTLVFHPKQQSLSPAPRPSPPRKHLQFDTAKEKQNKNSSWSLREKRTVLQCDVGIISVDGVQNALITNLALGSETNEATDIGIRRVRPLPSPHVVRISRHSAFTPLLSHPQLPAPRPLSLSLSPLLTNKLAHRMHAVPFKP